MKTIVNGKWDGQPITRQQTSGELLAELLYKQSQNKGRPDCCICEGSGTCYEPDGQDDVTPVPCDCVK
jgi:hypothetical protein